MGGKTNQLFRKSKVSREKLSDEELTYDFEVWSEGSEWKVGKYQN
jgi:hypothetical protein